MKSRIIFFWTPQIAADVYQGLLQEGVQIVAVVTNPDKPVGRSKQILPPPVKIVAQEQGVPIFQPVKVRGNHDFFAELRSLDADFFVVCAYGKILPQEVLDIPKLACLNIHFSLLPEYRGAAPIQWALLEGKKTTGITIQTMALGMDEGDIVATQEVTIGTFDTTSSLFDRCAQLSWPLCARALAGLSDGTVEGVSQDHTQATYTGKIEKEDGRIDPSISGYETFCKWRAYTPWPGIFFFLGEKRVAVTRCSWCDLDLPGQSGQLVDITSRNPHYELPEDIQKPKHTIALVHEKGCLILLEVKPEGKGAMPIDSFVQGHQQSIS